MDLGKEKCVPCEGGTKPMDSKEIKKYLTFLKTSWQVIDNKKISKEFIFKDFKEAIEFTNRVADLAENEGHHPDIQIHYNKIILELWTHAINGLSTNDFVLAFKIDSLN